AEHTGGGEHGRVVCMGAELTVGGRKGTGPVWGQPGHADDSITGHLGYGRDPGGQVLSQARGGNAYKVRGSEAPWVAVGTLTKAEGEYILASTQAHWSMMGRAPVRRANRDEYEQNLAAHNKNPNEVALFAKVGAVAKPEWQAIDELVPGS